MDRINNRIAHVYGYAVCLAAVIVTFFAIRQIIDSAINLSDPLRADMGGYSPMGRSLTSFELYRLQALRQPNFPMYGPMPVTAAPRNPADTSEAELRRLYDAERATAIGNARFRAIKSLVGNLLLIIFAGILFGMHWRWLRQRDALLDTP